MPLSEICLLTFDPLPSSAPLPTAFIEKVKAGKATAASSGFGGKGLERLEQDRDAKARAERSAYGEEDNKDAKGDGEEKAGGASGAGKEEVSGSAGGSAAATNKAHAAVAAKLDLPEIEVEVRRGPAPDTGRKGYGFKMNEANLAALKAAEDAAKQAGIDASGISKAQSVIAKLTASIQAKKQQQFGGAAGGGRGDRKDGKGQDGAELDIEAARRRDPDATDFHAVVPINDYPQKARWRITNQETMATLIESTGASITNKGVYYEKGKDPGPDDPPKLHLLIESNDDLKIKKAINEIRVILYEASLQALEAETRDPSGRGGGGRYNVL